MLDCLHTKYEREYGMLTYIDKLRGLREDNDLTQAQIAEILGASQTMYARYERGANELPIRHFIKLCKFYNVSADFLLGPHQILHENKKEACTVNKVFFGGGVFFYSVFPPYVCRDQRRCVYHNETTVCRNVFCRTQKSRCFRIENSGIRFVKLDYSCSQLCQTFCTSSSSSIMSMSFSISLICSSLSSF